MQRTPARSAVPFRVPPRVLRLVHILAMLGIGTLAGCATSDITEEPEAAPPNAGRQMTETEMKVRELQKRILAGPETPLPDWAIGPFRQRMVDGDSANFRMDVQWDDPVGAESWAAHAFWNPALLEVDGRIYIFYRTGPELEGLDSRIALAWSDDGGVTWTDYESNPLLYPAEPWEERSVEDPRVYKHDGRYYLFYIGVERRKDGGVYVDIAVASSDDLFNWTKHGRVMSREISGGWAKSPVIPRSPTGEAVMIDGEFLMFVSERAYAAELDVEEQMVGRSTDLINWEFEQRSFLAPNDEEIDRIFELATLTTGFPGSDDMVADVFYLNHEGQWACGEVLYSQAEPTRALDFTPYGVCSWGGKILYEGEWIYAQGWLERDVIQLYSAPPRGRDRPATRR